MYTHPHYTSCTTGPALYEHMHVSGQAAGSSFASSRLLGIAGQLHDGCANGCRMKCASYDAPTEASFCAQAFFYPMFSQLIVAPCILIAALILLWFQIKCAGMTNLQNMPLVFSRCSIVQLPCPIPIAPASLTASCCSWQQVGHIHWAGNAAAELPGDGAVCEAADGAAAAHAH